MIATKAHIERNPIGRFATVTFTTKEGDRRVLLHNVAKSASHKALVNRALAELRNVGSGGVAEGVHMAPWARYSWEIKSASGHSRKKLSPDEEPTSRQLAYLHGLVPQLRPAVTVEEFAKEHGKTLPLSRADVSRLIADANKRLGYRRMKPGERPSAHRDGTEAWVDNGYRPKGDYDWDIAPGGLQAAAFPEHRVPLKPKQPQQTGLFRKRTANRAARRRGER